MIYELWKLSDAEMVQSANDVVLPLLENAHITKVATNSIDAVIYTIYAHGSMPSVYKLMPLCKEVSLGRKVQISTNLKTGILFKFFGANKGRDIWISIIPNGEYGVELFL